MSAICSKKPHKFLDAVQSWVPKGRHDYKFSAFSQYLSLFFICLTLCCSFSPPSNSLTTYIAPLKLGDSWVCEFCRLVTLMFDPLFQTGLTIQSLQIPLLFVKHRFIFDPDLSALVFDTHMREELNMRTPVHMPLGSLCQVLLRATHINIHFSDSEFGIFLSLTCLQNIFRTNVWQWTFIRRLCVCVCVFAWSGTKYVQYFPAHSLFPVWAADCGICLHFWIQHFLSLVFCHRIYLIFSSFFHHHCVNVLFKVLM